MGRKKKVEEPQKPQKLQKIKIKVKTSRRCSWLPFELMSIDSEGWLKVKGVTKPYFWLHKDIHKNHIRYL